MKKNKIASVTILYNYDKNILENIKSYENLVNEVVLIDNSVSSEYYHKYEKILNKYTYISMNGNVGIAKALNAGIDYLKSKEYEWVLTLDQDSKLENNILDIYREYINNNDCEKIIILSPQYIFDRFISSKPYDTKELKYVMQSANLLNIDKFYKVGKFKEEFFIDMVDYEFCLRAHKFGYKIISCGNAKLNHSPAITKRSKLLKFKYGYCSKERIYYQSRNILWTYKQYKNINILFILIWKLFKIIAFYDEKKEYLKYYFKGISDCQNERFGIIDNE